MLKNCTPPERKPTFWHPTTFDIAFKIDQKTQKNLHLCQTAFSTPKNEDFTSKMPPTWTPQIFKFFYFSLQMCMDPLQVRRNTLGKPPGAYKQPPRTLQGHSQGPPEGLWTAFRTPMFNMFSSTKTINKQCEKQHKCGPFKAVTTATLKPVFEKTQTNK